MGGGLSVTHKEVRTKSGRKSLCLIFDISFTDAPGQGPWLMAEDRCVQSRSYRGAARTRFESQRHWQRRKPHLCEQQI